MCLDGTLMLESHNNFKISQLKYFSSADKDNTCPIVTHDE